MAYAKKQDRSVGVAGQRIQSLVAVEVLQLKVGPCRRRGRAGNERAIGLADQCIHEVVAPVGVLIGSDSDEVESAVIVQVAQLEGRNVLREGEVDVGSGPEWSVSIAQEGVNGRFVAEENGEERQDVEIAVRIDVADLHVGEASERRDRGGGKQRGLKGAVAMAQANFQDA